MSERRKQIFGAREPIDGLRLEGTRLTFIDSVIASICLVTDDYLTDYFKDLYRDRQTRSQFRERQIEFIMANPTPGLELALTQQMHPRLNRLEQAALGRILKQANLMD